MHMGIVHAKGCFLQRKGAAIRQRGKPEEYEQTGSREGTVEEVRCKRRRGQELMENDKEGEARYAGRAWAGHSEDIKWYGVGEEPSQGRGRLGQHTGQ